MLNKNVSDRGSMAFIIVLIVFFLVPLVVYGVLWRPFINYRPNVITVDDCFETTELLQKKAHCMNDTFCGKEF